MTDRSILRGFLTEALDALGGSGTPLEVCKQVWIDHEGELRDSGNLFYTWQYDIRWAAQQLRIDGTLEPVGNGRRAPWRLASNRIGSESR
jgi:hypothetical protein